MEAVKKVDLNDPIKKLEVFYDGRCGMCCTFIDWLKMQKHVFGLECLDYHDEGALSVFPDLMDYTPDKQIVVRIILNNEEGDDVRKVYLGGEAWVCCLWVCKKYSWSARLMNSRIFLPIAKKFCYFISGNRHGISRFFFRKKNAEIKCERGCEK